MRIGLFGGSFDPIHWGHLRIAEAFRHAFALSEVRLIPSAIPPHKPTGTQATFDQRMAMVVAATADAAGLVALDVEGRRPGLSFSIDTVRQCKADSSPSDELFFLVGLDAFLEMDSWKSYPDLFRLLTIVVAGRPEDGGAPGALAARATEFVVGRIDADYRLAPTGDRLNHPSWPPVHLFDGPAISVSSTQVRTRIARRQPVDDLVPPAVAYYIEQEGLYR